MRKLALAAFAALICTQVNAADFDPKLAENVILSSAGDEGYDEMYAIAACLRNMEPLHVQYELQTGPEVIEQLPANLREMAQHAWKESETGDDPTSGANFWYNAPDTGGYMRPDTYWLPPQAKDEFFTIQIGRHRFYKVPADFQPKRPRG